MPYFRITYEGYVEDEFDSEEEAINTFVETVQTDLENEDYTHVGIEKYNDEKGEWE